MLKLRFFFVKKNVSQRVRITYKKLKVLGWLYSRFNKKVKLSYVVCILLNLLDDHATLNP